MMKVVLTTKQSEWCIEMTSIKTEFLDASSTSLCEKLCHEATTVSQHNVCKSRLDEIEKLYPAVGQFINWWHDRRIHIFPPFYGVITGCESL